MATRLTESEIEALGDTLPEWSVEGDRLRREFSFADFSEAFGFMARVALVAESLNHHPEWSNVWADVTIELTTHDVDGLSDLDVSFAQEVDSLL